MKNKFSNQTIQNFNNVIQNATNKTYKLNYYDYNSYYNLLLGTLRLQLPLPEMSYHEFACRLILATLKDATPYEEELFNSKSACLLASVTRAARLSDKPGSKGYAYELYNLFSSYEAIREISETVRMDKNMEEGVVVYRGPYGIDWYDLENLRQSVADYKKFEYQPNEIIDEINGTRKTKNKFTAETIQEVNNIVNDAMIKTQTINLDYSEWNSYYNLLLGILCLQLPKMYYYEFATALIMSTVICKTPDEEKIFNSKRTCLGESLAQAAQLSKQQGKGFGFELYNALSSNEAIREVSEAVKTDMEEIKFRKDYYDLEGLRQAVADYRKLEYQPNEVIDETKGTRKL